MTLEYVPEYTKEQISNQLGGLWAISDFRKLINDGNTTIADFRANFGG
jgi:hypothetical protein